MSEEKYRKEFEDEVLNSPYSAYADISRSERHPNEYNQQAVTHKWLWYLAGRKHSEAELRKLEESVKERSIALRLNRDFHQEDLDKLLSVIKYRDKRIAELEELVRELAKIIKEQHFIIDESGFEKTQKFCNWEEKATAILGEKE